jgi:phosphopantetheine adenylyltransferase
MHNINFLNATPPEKQHALQHWYHISLLLFLILFLSLGAISSWQFYQLKTAKKYTQAKQHKAQSFAPILAHKKKLENELAILTKKTESIKKLRITTEQKHSFLTALQKACSKQVQLNSACFKDDPQEIIIYASDTPAAVNFIRRLQENSGIKDLFIASLEPAPQQDNENLLINIKRAINKRLNNT